MGCGPDLPCGINSIVKPKTENKILIGIDLGGTNIKVGLVTPEGRLLAEARAPTDVPAGAAQAAGRMVELAQKLLPKHGLDASRIIAAGIGSPGPLNTRTGCIVATPNLHGWDGAPLAPMVAKGLGIPAFLEGDANAACWGEHWVGAGRGVDNMIMITLGTGVGGGAIVRGELIRGADDTGGHIGHMVVTADGRTCSCGRKGCLEAYASATATVRRFREAVQRGEKSSLAVSDGLTTADIHKAAVAGDALARHTIEGTGRYVGIVLGGLANLLNPELCCVSGGMINAGEMLFAPMRQALMEHAFEMPAKRLKIVPAQLGESAGIIGAAGCALQRSAAR
jgi:glucokinase